MKSACFCFIFGKLASGKAVEIMENCVCVQVRVGRYSFNPVFTFYRRQSWGAKKRVFHKVTWLARSEESHGLGLLTSRTVFFIFYIFLFWWKDCRVHYSAEDSVVWKQLLKFLEWENGVVICLWGYCRRLSLGDWKTLWLLIGVMRYLW
jgi:hypothetical protein